MRQRLLLPEAVILALLGLWGWLLVSPLLHRKPRPRPQPKPQLLGVPTKANFDRIEQGMTGQEVESILGPPGNRTSRDPPWGTADEQSWMTEDGIFIVKYDADSSGPPE